jgi:hypothetical protein
MEELQENYENISEVVNHRLKSVQVECSRSLYQLRVMEYETIIWNGSGHIKDNSVYSS